MKYLSLHKIGLMLLFLILAANSFAQYNPTVMFSEHFQTQRSRFEPSYLGTNGEKIEVNVAPAFINLHLWTGNTFINAQTVRGFIAGGVTNGDVEELIGNLKDKNRLSAGANLQLLAVAIQVESERNMAFSFEVNERAELSLTFPKEFAELIWYGNGQFNNQSQEFNNFGANGFWAREFVIGGAMDITEFGFGDFKLRAGLRLKYIQGMAAINTQRANVTLTSTADSLALQPDYRFDIAGVGDDEFSANRKGGGFGVDLGATITYQENLKASLSFLDIGFVNFNQNARNYTGNSRVSFGGFELTTAGLTDTEDLLDSLSGKLEGTETKEAFRLALPTRMVLQAEYSLPAGEANSHKFFFNYTQGFRDFGGTTSRPLIALAYVYNINNKFNFGVAPTFLGYNSAGLGMFATGKLGVFKFGIGSGNIITLASGINKGRLIDFSLNIGASF